MRVVSVVCSVLQITACTSVHCTILELFMLFVLTSAHFLAHLLSTGHSCEHELETARINGVLGNIDANTGVGGLQAICTAQMCEP